MSLILSLPKTPVLPRRLHLLSSKSFLTSRPTIHWLATLLSHSQLETDFKKFLLLSFAHCTTSPPPIPQLTTMAFSLMSREHYNMPCGLSNFTINPCAKMCSEMRPRGQLIPVLVLSMCSMDPERQDRWRTSTPAMLPISHTAKNTRNCRSVTAFLFASTPSLRLLHCEK